MRSIKIIIYNQSPYHLQLGAFGNTIHQSLNSRNLVLIHMYYNTCFDNHLDFICIILHNHKSGPIHYIHNNRYSDIYYKHPSLYPYTNLCINYSRKTKNYHWIQYNSGYWYPDSTGRILLSARTSHHYNKKRNPNLLRLLLMGSENDIPARYLMFCRIFSYTWYLVVCKSR